MDWELAASDMRLVVLAGASGSGKTTIAEAVAAGSPDVTVLHFDHVGVPSTAAMVAGWGSGEAWQRAMAMQWMARIAATCQHQAAVLFEGQARLAYLREALAAAGLTGAHLILLDCDDATRTDRLARARMQPELATARMMHWARYLRQEARDAGDEVLNTGEVPRARCVELIRERLGLPMRGGRRMRPELGLTPITPLRASVSGSPKARQ